MKKNKKLVSAIDAAISMRISPQRLYQYIKVGIFKTAFKQLGTRWFMEQWEVDNFVSGKMSVKGAYSGKLEKR